jgi:hypothetical protein
MSLRGTYIEKCKHILNWADEHPEFDEGFIKSVLSQMEHGNREPTDKQANAIDNIIGRFKIDLPDPEMDARRFEMDLEEL